MNLYVIHEIGILRYICTKQSGRVKMHGNALDFYTEDTVISMQGSYVI